MSFQQFRQCMMRLPEIAYQRPGIPSWCIIRMRVLKRLSKEKMPKRKLKHFRKLALALAKYDFFGAPSNWEKRYNHEDYVIKWAYSVTSRSRVTTLISQLEKGLIPDAFEEMMDYCT